MPRPTFMTALLGSLTATPEDATPGEVTPAGTDDIGFVLCTKSSAPGTLNARWIFTDQYRGPGIATGGPREGFAGRYHVRCFLEDGAFSDEVDLRIERSGDVDEATWLADGQVQAVDVGMEVDDGLAIGWRRVG